MNVWVTTIGSLFAIIIGLWKFFSRKSADKRVRIEEANKQFQEGMAERDPSKIIGSNDRINNDV